MTQALDPSPPLSLQLYRQIGQRVARLIESGAFKTGQRLPSLRDMSTQEGVSLSTVMQAFQWLEEQGLVKARPKVGYFVLDRPRSRPPLKALPAQDRVWVESAPIREDLLDGPHGAPERANFALFRPWESGLFDEQRIRIALARATRVHRRSLIDYCSQTAGARPLRQAIAQRALHLGCTLDAQRITITHSCVQAVSLCLMAVTRPGDLVAVESPTFFGFLDILEALHLRVVEIPSHPQKGMELSALALALQTQPVRVVLAVPTLSNPQGAIMPLARKRELLKLLRQHQVPLIEDVVFNDLLASDERRRAVKSLDLDDLVMICGSFSKTLTPGIRLGWVEAGRWSRRVQSLKRLQGAVTNEVLEHALADLLTQTTYESQMRRVCAAMKQRLGQARQCVRDHFPKGTQVTDPAAGYTLWVQLPDPRMDSLELFECAAREGIRIAPGCLFSTSSRFNHCLRLSFSGAWGQEEQSALKRLGALAHELWPARCTQWALS